jgi:hypothetical protein
LSGGVCDAQHDATTTNGTIENKTRTSDPKDNKIMSTPPQASRPPAPQIQPIEYKGVRYEQDRLDASKGDQNGGYLAAFDPKTGRKLWRLQVYQVSDHSAAGVDNLGRYFRSMRLISGRDEIEIENESGGRYLVDLTKRTSTLVSPLESATKPAPPPKPKPQP